MKSAVAIFLLVGIIFSSCTHRRHGHLPNRPGKKVKTTNVTRAFKSHPLTAESPISEATVSEVEGHGKHLAPISSEQRVNSQSDGGLSIVNGKVNNDRNRTEPFTITQPLKKEVGSLKKRSKSLKQRIENHGLKNQNAPKSAEVILALLIIFGIPLLVMVVLGKLTTLTGTVVLLIGALVLLAIFLTFIGIMMS